MNGIEKIFDDLSSFDLEFDFELPELDFDMPEINFDDLNIPDLL